MAGLIAVAASTTQNGEGGAVINPNATLVRTADLAQALDVHPDTVSRWRCTVLRPAIFRRGYFKVSVLRSLGFLPEPPDEETPPPRTDAERIAALESEVATLKREVAELRRR
jgi:hypothetical protein